MLIEIVSHCYASELPHYAGALCYQLSSFVLYPPKNCDVQVTICCTRTDEKTVQMLEWFYDQPFMVGITLSIEQLGRRSIGRNIAAKQSKADIVWFADVDQVYHEGCLDRLAEFEWPDDVVMIFPPNIKIHKDWKTGDLRTGVVMNDPQLVDIDPTEFVDKKYHRAIGGVQIVRGDFARKYGYVDEWPKARQPREDGVPFGDFKDDLVFRRFCRKKGKTIPVELPGMFRLSHRKIFNQPSKQ